ncbi:MAG: cysteine desulfurase, partial [Bdellovibrionales bacterium]|nr:cysteine desulfurase [Bdellovibrionales bacterium]
YDGARVTVQRFLNAASADEIVFTRGTTEAINLVAQAWGRAHLGPGDDVLVTRMEHHSNFVPWQSIARERGANFRIVETGDDWRLDLGHLEKLLRQGRPKVLAVTAMSNVLGTVNPVAEIAALAKSHGALVVVDGAQAMAHRPLTVAELGPIDFLAFSGHKMCGPTGIGVLWGRREILERMPPWQFGGDMILQVGDEATTWNELPYKFEAGTPSYADAIAFGAALDYLAELGWERIAAHEAELVSYGRGLLEKIPGVRVLAPRDPAFHGAVLSFTAEGVHPHDMATFLDAEGIAVRAGHHCAQPLMRKLGVAATNRASVSFYNTKEEMALLAGGVRRAMEYFA